ncbi:Hypp4365 [Branchiostoma lanceolatum]|uniref:Hypp4365 protein n=1 Tax=Branchiostoma lanceolatum TaxID=7740 RepID=A0A8K0A862_BRALA|nr:Hypp4365 [Branchiostoma lanceolatum]
MHTSIEAATSQGASTIKATTAQAVSTAAATNAAEATTESPATLVTCKNYDFLCTLDDIPIIALLVAPGVGLLLISVVIAVSCGACRRRADEDDEIFLERERTSQIAMHDYRSNMAASSVDGDDDFSRRQKTNPAYMEDDELAMSPYNHSQKNYGRPSVSSGSDRMAMDNNRSKRKRCPLSFVLPYIQRQRMSMASVDRPYGDDQRRPGPHYPEDDMRHPPAVDPRGRPAQYGDDPRRPGPRYGDMAGPRYMEEDPRRPPPDSRGRPKPPMDRDDGRRPLAAGSMYDKSEPRGGPRPQPRESVAAGKRNWAKQSAAQHDVPPADYDDGFPNPRSSYAGFRQDTNNYY